MKRNQVRFFINGLDIQIIALAINLTASKINNYNFMDFSSFLDTSKEGSKNTNQINKKKDNKGSGGMQQKSISDQTLQAALQFGVLVRIL